MIAVNNFDPVKVNAKVNSSELIEKVVGTIHPIQAGAATRFAQAIADLSVRTFTSQGREQAAVRKSLQDLAKQINSSGDPKAQFEASRKAFHERLNSLGTGSYTQEQVAPIFKEAMTALASARRNPVEALAADKVEVLDGLLGIKKPVKESSSPYKKVALGVGIAALFVLAGIAAYAFLTEGKSPHLTKGKSLQSDVCPLPGFSFANSTQKYLAQNGTCPIRNVQESYSLSSFVDKLRSVSGL